MPRGPVLGDPSGRGQGIGSGPPVAGGLKRPVGRGPGPPRRIRGAGARRWPSSSVCTCRCRSRIQSSSGVLSNLGPGRRSGDSPGCEFGRTAASRGGPDSRCCSSGRRGRLPGGNSSRPGPPPCLPLKPPRGSSTNASERAFRRMAKSANRLWVEQAPEPSPRERTKV